MVRVSPMYAQFFRVSNSAFRSLPAVGAQLPFSMMEIYLFCTLRAFMSATRFSIFGKRPLL